LDLDYCCYYNADIIIQMISIILPFYNHWDLTHQRLMECHKFLPDDVEIILVNDASTETDCDGGVAFWQKAENRQKIRYIKNKENLGFGGSMNRGAKFAEGDILIFLSNDVIISGNFVEQIKKEIENEKDILIGGRIIYWRAGWNEISHNGLDFVVPYAEGWLVACTKKVWDNLGGFDLLYGKYAFEDIDLSTKAIELGYRLVGLASPYLKHIGAQTAGYTEERMQITIDNKEKYIEKWKDKFDLIGEASHHG
jgi:GT2 family glycosyltransferase